MESASFRPRVDLPEAAGPSMAMMFGIGIGISRSGGWSTLAVEHQVGAHPQDDILAQDGHLAINEPLQPFGRFGMTPISHFAEGKRFAPIIGCQAKLVDGRNDHFGGRIRSKAR